MSLILDTSIIIEIERGNIKIIKDLQNIRAEYPELPSISFITYFEILSGLIEKSPFNKNKALSHISLFPVLSADKITAKIIAELKYNYDKKGIAIPLADLIIAAQTIQHRMKLLTRDALFNKIAEIDKKIV